MLGTIVNALAVIVGGSIGLLLHSNLNSKYQTIYFQAVGLFTLAIGVVLLSQMQLMLPVVFALVCGGLTGTFLQLDTRIEAISTFIKKRSKSKNERFTEGFVTAFVMFCVGSMTIVGSIEEGLGKTPTILYTKSFMDGFSALLLASVLGVGVLFSAIPLFIFQAAITLLAMYIGQFFSPEILREIGSVGGVLLIGLGLSILEIKKINIVNLLPSLMYIVLFVWIWQLFF